MKVKFSKIKLDKLIVFFVIWVIGILLFIGMIYLLKYKFQYKFVWDTVLMISVPAGLLWTLIGTQMMNKDEKIVAGRKAISAAVSHCFPHKPKL